MKRIALLIAILALPPPAFAQQNPDRLALPNTAKVTDSMNLLPPSNTHLGGLLGERFDRNERNRLLHVDEEELLAGFRHRPGKQAWIGEHVGKWLHAASLAYAATGDQALRSKLDRVVDELLKCQEPDGYLGTYVAEKRFGLYPDADWDVWVHKYDLLGLLAYYQYTGNRDALMGAKKVGDLLIRTFGPGKKSIISAGTHMGMASTSVLEPTVLLYRATADSKYLDFARSIVDSWEEPKGPHILTTLLTQKSVRRTANAKAYEMLSNLNGLCELYRVTGNKDYLTAVLNAWDDVVARRLYITGSGSSHEVWQDEGHLPTGGGANICETCVTVTWEQLNLQLLRVLGEARFADQLERSVYNHLLGAQKPTGDAWCYYTPLTGTKPYGSSTNCCLSSGPRGVALLPAFAYSTTADGVAVNLYGDSEVDATVKSVVVKIEQKSDYPIERRARFVVRPERNPTELTLRFRSPAWSQIKDMRLNGKPINVPAVQNGYIPVRRKWKSGDTIELSFTPKIEVLTGSGDTAGRMAITVGPLVLAGDEGHNPELRPLTRVSLTKNVNVRMTGRGRDGEPVYETSATFEQPGSAPKEATLRLVPFYAAGADGSRFDVWLRAAGSSTTSSSSLFYHAAESWSRDGNVGGEIADDDPSTFRVTFDNSPQREAWFAVGLAKPVVIDEVVFCHGRSFHDGGWFDTSAGKPRIQIKKQPNGPWEDVGLLDSYPATSAAFGADMEDGKKFTVQIQPVAACAVRVIGKPACGDNPAQGFASCAELQARRRSK